MVHSRIDLSLLQQDTWETAEERQWRLQDLSLHCQSAMTSEERQWIQAALKTLLK